MTKPADHPVRQRALDPHTSFIVQAPAGSGKTELLIRRFLVLLSRVHHPEEVVAITFTRKAAAEMRERVLDAVRRAQQPCPKDEFERELWRVANEAWRNNQARDWRLEQHPARLRIQTIDALCAALTSQLPLLSRSGATLSVVEDASELYREAALRTVWLLGGAERSWSQAVAVLLAHVDNRVSRAVELIVEMLRRRDQWLRHIGGGLECESDARRASLESAWEQLTERELSAARRVLPEAMAEELVACATYAAQQLAPSQLASPLNAWGGGGGFPGTASADLPRWRGLSELLLRKDGGWRQKVDKRHGFPAGKSPRAQMMRQRMHDTLQALAAHEKFRCALGSVSRLPDSRYTDEQWQVVSSLIRLLPLAAAQLDVIFAGAGCVDFIELNRRANWALGEPDNPTDLALALDYRIQHLLVDEFQDTSLSQFALLQRLTAGWQPEDGRTLFLVGDPMQSIYRFREAEVGLFEQVVAGGLGSVRTESLSLEANFRSDPSIVAWINRCFHTHPPTPSAARRGAVTFAPSAAAVAASANCGVSVHPLRDAQRVTQARMVAEVITQTRRQRPQHSVAVLVRSRTHLREIIPALNHAGVEYVGVEIDSLVRQPVVQDLLSLTQALLNPADRMAWLAILKAPWCGLSLRDLFSLVADDAGRCVWDQLQSQSVLATLGAEGRQRAERTASVIGQSLAHRGRGSLRDWVARTWEQLGGPACVSPRALGYADNFLALLGEHDAGGRVANSSALRRALHDTWVRPEVDPDATVQIMTVHKAKGLEFDTVIIPALERTPRHEESKLLLWEEDATAHGESLLLAPLPGPGRRADPHYDCLRQLRADKDAFEVARLLYVGCTRARRNLHLIAAADSLPDGRVGAPAVTSFLHRLWPVVQPEFAAAGGRQVPAAKTPVTSPGPLQRLPVDWRVPEPATPMPAVMPPPDRGVGADIEFSWVGEKTRQLGILVHEYLQQLPTREGLASGDRDVQPQLARWRKALKARGIADDELQAYLIQLQQVARDIAEDPRGRWLFDATHRDVHSEYALSGVVDGVVRHIRIDRTFIDRNGIRWIVDFKSSAHRGGRLEEFLDREVQRYRSQLECYARMIGAMEDRTIRLGLYFPLLRRWREWPYRGA